MLIENALKSSYSIVVILIVVSLIVVVECYRQNIRSAIDSNHLNKLPVCFSSVPFSFTETKTDTQSSRHNCSVRIRIRVYKILTQQLKVLNFIKFNKFCTAGRFERYIRSKQLDSHRSNILWWGAIHKFWARKVIITLDHHLLRPF